VMRRILFPSFFHLSLLVADGDFARMANVTIISTSENPGEPPSPWCWCKVRLHHGAWCMVRLHHGAWYASTMVHGTPPPWFKVRLHHGSRYTSTLVHGAWCASTMVHVAPTAAMHEGSPGSSLRCLTSPPRAPRRPWAPPRTRPPRAWRRVCPCPRARPC